MILFKNKLILAFSAINASYSFQYIITLSRNFGTFPVAVSTQFIGSVPVSYTHLTLPTILLV